MRQQRDMLGGLARSYLLVGLGREELEPLAAVATTRSLVRGEYLWRLGDPANELYVVANGELKGFLSGPNGEELVHLLHGPGMTLGEPGYFSIERTRSIAEMAIAPAEVIRLDRHDLDPFLREHPSVKDRALEGLAGMLRWYGSVVMGMGARPLRDRVLLRLLDLADDQAGPGEVITTAISQSTLAAMTGVSRENVNRALAALMAEGTIRREGSRYVLLDEVRLRAEVARDWPVLRTIDRRQPE